jgi:hypothetical protein
LKLKAKIERSCFLIHIQALKPGALLTRVSSPFNLHRLTVDSSSAMVLSRSATMRSAVACAAASVLAAAAASVQGHMDSARHIIKRISNPRIYSYDDIL